VQVVSSASLHSLHLINYQLYFFRFVLILAITPIVSPEQWLHHYRIVKIVFHSRNLLEARVKYGEMDTLQGAQYYTHNEEIGPVGPLGDVCLLSPRNEVPAGEGSNLNQKVKLLGELNDI
jgi:hypothetical protein